jgi:hypothetical protein
VRAEIRAMLVGYRIGRISRAGAMQKSNNGRRRHVPAKQALFEWQGHSSAIAR